MACDLGNYLNDMEEKGYSETEALDMLPSDKVASALADSDKDIVVAALDSENTNVRIKAVNVAGGWDQKTLLTTKDENGNPLNQNTDIAKAYNNAHGGNTNIAALTGTFDNKKANDGKYMQNRLVNGDEDAIKYAQSVASSGDQTKIVAFVETLRNGGMTNYDVQNISGAGQSLSNSYKSYYDDIGNVGTSDLVVNNAGTGASATYTDAMGNKHTWQVVQGGSLLVPVGTNADGSTRYEYVSQAGYLSKKVDQYNTATWAIKLDKYIEEVLQSDDPVSAAKIFAEESKKSVTDWYTCTGTGCPGASTGKESSGSGGSGGTGSTKSTSSTTSARDTTLYINTKGVDAKIYENGILLGNANELIEVNEGKHQLVLKAEGYIDEEVGADISAGQQKTMTVYMDKVTPDACTLTLALGGLSKLTENHILKYFCLYKYKATKYQGWKDLADEIEVDPDITMDLLPNTITKNDVRLMIAWIRGNTNDAIELISLGQACVDSKGVGL